MTKLRHLARFASELRLEDVSGEVVSGAKYCVLDSVGAALGATGYEQLPEICQEVKEWTGENGLRQAAVWGQGFRLDVSPALLLNGMMGHALELDDVHTRSKSHIGTVVVETAWTLSDALGGNGKNFLEAVIVGYEIMSRVGMAMDVASSRKRGWHGTGVIGTFGAAAAAGHLLELSEERMVWALGMAGTQSSGLWAFLGEGSTCKKLHPARAAVNGLTAAILARAGMTGPEHILDAPDGGLYQAVSDFFDMDEVDKELGQRYEILEMDKKPYPCCRTTHHAIDAALALRRQVSPEQIKEIRVETYEVGVLQCGSPAYPMSPVEAKFSISYTVAAGLARGKVSLAEFTWEALQDEGIRKLAGKVSVVESPLFSRRYPKRWGCCMEITKKDGTILRKQIDDMSGSRACPLTKAQELEKFLGLTEPVLGTEKSRNLAEEILRIEKRKRMPEI